MSIEVGVRALRERWRPLAFFSGVAVAYIVVVTALWPTMRDNDDAQASVADYPELFKAVFGGEQAFDMSVASGYLEAWVFSLVLPVLIGVFAVVFAARTLAGEEESGQLELVLSTPTSRRSLVLEKALALAVAVLGLGLVAWLVLLVMDLIVDLEVGVARLLAATLGAALAMLVYGVVALLVGSATGSRSFALAAGGLALGIGYALTVVAELATEAEWIRFLSPYYYGVGTDPLLRGWPVSAHGALLVLALVGTAAAVVVFERRDVAT